MSRLSFTLIETDCTSSKITCTGHSTATGGDDLTPADSNSNLSHQRTEAKG